MFSLFCFTSTPLSVAEEELCDADNAANFYIKAGRSLRSSISDNAEIKSNGLIVSDDFIVYVPVEQKHLIANYVLPETVQLLSRGATCGRCDWGSHFEDGLVSQILYLTEMQVLIDSLIEYDIHLLENGKTSEGLTLWVDIMTLIRHLSYNRVLVSVSASCKAEMKCLDVILHRMRLLNEDNIFFLIEKCRRIPERISVCESLDYQKEIMLKWMKMKPLSFYQYFFPDQTVSFYTDGTLVGYPNSIPFESLMPGIIFVAKTKSGLIDLKLVELYLDKMKRVAGMAWEDRESATLLLYDDIKDIKSEVEKTILKRYLPHTLWRNTEQIADEKRMFFDSTLRVYYEYLREPACEKCNVFLGRMQYNKQGNGFDLQYSTQSRRHRITITDTKALYSEVFVQQHQEKSAPVQWISPDPKP